MNRPGWLAHDRGSTLVEVAVVSVVVAVVLALGIGIYWTRGKQQKREATRSRLIAAESALALFAASNQRLPCPADGALPSTDANAGQERTIGTGTTIQCGLGGVANSQAHGVLPWKSLKLGESDATDGWGTRLTYRVAPEFVGQGAMNLSACDPSGTAPVAMLTVPTGYCNAACATPFFPSNCTPPGNVTVARGLQVRNLAGTIVMDPADNTGAAYVVISHGENRAGGYDSGGALRDATGPALGTEEAKNVVALAAGNYYVDDFPVYGDKASHFDDFVIRPTILTVVMRAQLAPRTH